MLSDQVRPVSSGAAHLVSAILPVSSSEPALRRRNRLLVVSPSRGFRSGQGLWIFTNGLPGKTADNGSFRDVSFQLVPRPSHGHNSSGAVPWRDGWVFSPPVLRQIGLSDLRADGRRAFREPFFRTSRFSGRLILWFLLAARLVTVRRFRYNSLPNNLLKHFVLKPYPADRQTKCRRRHGRTYAAHSHFCS